MMYSLFDYKSVLLYYTIKTIKTALHCLSEKEPPRILRSNRRVVGKASDPIVNVTIGDKIFVEADSVIEIACPSTGKPTPKITWQRRGLSDFFSCFIYSKTFQIDYKKNENLQSSFLKKATER